jgi:trehalose utilization protein
MHIINKHHPIARDVNDFLIPNTELYAERFDVPEPNDVIVEGTWKDGKKSREVMTWQRGKGRIVYIRAGHETYPIYKMPQMLQLIKNAVAWAAKKT